MSIKLKAVPAIIAAAGLAVSGMAQVPMQTVQDSAKDNRLIINGQPLFISGMNLAWNNFARDVGDQAINRSAMTNYIKQIREAGGNAMRWWLHTDATHCPKFEGTTGKVTGLGSESINNMRAVLDSAYKYGVVVSMCLFSFDILHNDGGNKNPDQMTNNKNFMTVESNLDTYITNALRPILDAIGSHPAIMCWEVFNEPEGMSLAVGTSGGGWATEKIDHSHIMRFTNKIAGEVHRRTKKMASTGIHNFSQYKGVYSDAKLKAAGGDDDGWLDFYMAHHYPEWDGTSESPFHQDASHWNFDRPVLIGEFPAQSWGTGQTSSWKYSMTIIDAFEAAYTRGYCGAMSWAFHQAGGNGVFGSYATTKPALENLYAKYQSDIKIKTGVDIDPPQTGDLAMKITFNALATGDANEALFKYETNVSLSGRTNLTFDMYIDPSSGSGLQMYTAIQAASTWDWFETPARNLGSDAKGQWITVTLPLSSFGSLNPSSVNVHAIFLKFVASGSPFTGVIYIDNVKLDNTVISNFNEQYSEWGSAAGTAESSIAARPSASSVRYGVKVTNAVGRTPAVSVRGRMLNIAGIDNSPMSIRLINVNGKTVARFTAQGRGAFSLAKIPAGRYVVETKVAGKRVGTSAVVVR